MYTFKSHRLKMWNYSKHIILQTAKSACVEILYLQNILVIVKNVCQCFSISFM